MRAKTVQLACDRCSTHRQAKIGVSTEQLREQLTQVGWLCDHANDRDLCPPCIGVAL